MLPLHPHRGWIALAALMAAAAAGCQSQNPSIAAASDATTRPIPGLTAPAANANVIATTDPPVGWVSQPLESDAQHTQQTWVSPSSNTAYGVAHIKLPLPFGLLGWDRILGGIVDNMKTDQKTAEITSRQTDPSLPGLRVEIHGGEYEVRGNLIASGWEAWFVFASTSNDDPIVQKELDLAILARDHTVIGVRTGP